MKEKNPISKNKNRLFSMSTGLIMLGLNALWLYTTTSLLYSYNYTTKLYFFMVPTWILLVEIIFALTGIYIGQLIIRNKIKTLKWLLIDLLLVITGIGISIIYTSQTKKNDRITHAYVHRLAEVHLAGFAPAFTLSLCDSEYARKPPVPIASVVMFNF